MAIQGAAPDVGRITPHLLVRQGRKAIEFYQRAFGATVLYLSPMPHGDGIHAHLRIANTVVMISDSGEMKNDPLSLGGSSTILELYVDDADAVAKHAVEAGATETMP